MSNVDLLHDAHVLNRDVLTPEQQEFINRELSHEEVHDLIHVCHKLARYCKHHQPSFAGAITSPYPP